MFCGYCFASDKKSLQTNSVSSNNIVKLKISSAIYTEIYATVKIIDILKFVGIIPSDWTFDTRIHARFDQNLTGGNVSFDERITEAIRIKKRTKKDTKFQTIFEKPIKTNDDFQIELMDYYQPCGEIEYAYVPIISGGENKYIVTSVESKFNRGFIVERGKSYPLDINFTYTETMNYENSVVKPFGRKYPVAIINGNTGYKSGDIECTFIGVKNGELDTNRAFGYREAIINMLTNGQAKLFKDADGNLIMIHINGNVSDSNRQYVHNKNHGFYYVGTKFSFVETGNAYYTGDLYDNNFIDADRDR